MMKYGIEVELNILLNKKQRKYLEAINWSLNKARYFKAKFYGRGFLLAVVFICKALERRDSWVEVFDYFPWRKGRQTVFKQVVMLIKRNEELLELTEFNPSNYTFRIKKEFNTFIKFN